MDMQEINERVAQIAASGDDEEQHGMEDSLYEDVLKAIAEGAPNASELAAAALKTKDMDFSRWYA
ncbi:hypothetical protein D0Z67_29545 (plasmid) [Streptomyces seoulensis]|uniref:Uncharacterized protein n=1 Tax=Streptomyces seoulensis TaxID=73044 RepID=A0A4P6U5U6_STRSO|nr:hypothetical protein [Streptomyces seoulensis]QBJ94514.1 hypothetical protein D0Z67_29545 [Streptomyces seoulensis]